jgi:hypothetical protein
MAINTYKLALKYISIGIKIPNGHDAHQNFPSRGLPKCTKIGIFGLKNENISTGNPDPYLCTSLHMYFSTSFGANFLSSVVNN